jgi:hypothetical protein
MAEQAAIRDLAAEPEVIRAVVGRAHRPVTPLLGVPRYRKFDQFAAGLPGQIAARMISDPKMY